MLELSVSVREATAVQRLARQVGRQYRTSDSQELLDDLPGLVQGLPSRIREELMSYMDGPTADVVLIHDHLVDDEALGTTPPAPKSSTESIDASLEHEMVAMLYGSILGHVFGWATQQRGHLVNDLVPVAALADSQVGASSRVELAWHTEDAFHPGRADFLCLVCLRNPSGASTTVASVGDVLQQLDTPPHALFDPCVIIPADDAQAAGAEEIDANAWTGPSLEPVPILTTTPSGIEMRIDPAYMSVSVDDPSVHDAVTHFCETLEGQLQDVIMQPGDVLVLNNRRVVHGRRPFKPAYDGRDRWMKRVNIARAFESRIPFCADVEKRLLA
jgi:Fe(II)/alpha-ketoglutarate-dependent arginine beta-hydroxylase